MNKITQNGISIIQTTDYLEVNGERTYLPNYVKKSGSNSIDIDSTKQKIIVNGYAFDLITKTFENEKPIKKFFSRLFG